MKAWCCFWVRALVHHRTGVAGPDYLAYHISNYQDGHKATPEENVRTTMTTFVDLVLLARAHCLVWSPSGFPIVAMVSA